MIFANQSQEKNHKILQLINGKKASITDHSHTLTKKCKSFQLLERKCCKILQSIVGKKKILKSLSCLMTKYEIVN